MNKTALLAAASAIALCSGAAPARNVTVPPYSGKTSLFPKVAKILYSQNSNDAGTPISSQIFTTSSYSSPFNDQAADDFVIPKGRTWTITEIDVRGVYYQGTAQNVSENVGFYADRKGMPGNPVRRGTFNNLDGGTGPDFAIRLPGKGITLGAGKYWVSAVAELAFAYWGWEVNSAQHGNQAMWQNPGGGFHICKTWGTIQDCAGAGPDLMFVLRGTSKRN